MTFYFTIYTKIGTRKKTPPASGERCCVENIAIFIYFMDRCLKSRKSYTVGLALTTLEASVYKALRKTAS